MTDLVERHCVELCADAIKLFKRQKGWLLESTKGREAVLKSAAQRREFGLISGEKAHASKTSKEHKGAS